MTTIAGTMRHAHRPFRSRRPLVVTIVGLSIVVAACGVSEAPVTSLEIEPRGGSEVEELLSQRDDGDSVDASIPARPAFDSEDIEASTEDRSASTSALAAAITPFGTASGLDDLGAPAGPTPLSIDIPSLGVRSAPIVAAGVESSGEMEIPGADQVGWYRHGPRPGDEGSSVLAAHIAYDGRDGVFRDLGDLAPGERFSVTFDDGTMEEFVAIGLRQWSKTEIPLDDLFSRDGTPRLALITCGGNFNPSLSSYDDNIVVIAVPLDFAMGDR